MPYTITPSRIGLPGGDEIVIGGVFPLATDIVVHLGPAGDQTDPPCYAGPGSKFTARSVDGATVKVYSPPVAAEGTKTVSMTVGGVPATAGTIEAVAVPQRGMVVEMRHLTLPWLDAGPRE